MVNGYAACTADFSKIKVELHTDMEVRQLPLPASPLIITLGPSHGAHMGVIRAMGIWAASKGINSLHMYRHTATRRITEDATT